MTVIVRDFQPEDGDGFARVRRATVPFLLSTAESIVFDVAHAHPQARFMPLIAEEADEIIGTATVDVAYESREPDVGNANVYVHPDHRGRGVGSALVTAAEARLSAHGVGKVYSWLLDEPVNHAFAAGRGYRPSRPAHFLRLDLAHCALPPLLPPPPGVELRTAADFADDPRPLFALDAETMLDEPSDIDVEYSDYEQWLTGIWCHPLLDHALTSVAVVDGRPVTFTEARTDGSGRYMTAMTGTARGHRGRGLARLVKNHALHRARAAGCTEAFTGNDAGNTAMLAVNTWLGYEICATEVRYVRELG